MDSVFAATQPLAWLSTALWIASLLLIVVMHVWSSDINPIRTPFASYGAGDGKPLYVIHGLTGAIALLLLAALFKELPDSNIATVVPLYLLLASVARIGVVLLPHSTGSLLRLAAETGSFAFPYLAIATATPLLAQTSPTLGNSWMALWWLVAASLAGTVLATIRPLRPVFGLLERSFLIVCEAWFLSASLRFTML